MAPWVLVAMLPLVGAVAAVALVAPHPVRIAAINWTATPLKVASTASTVEVSQPHPAWPTCCRGRCCCCCRRRLCCSA